MKKLSIAPVLTVFISSLFFCSAYAQEANSQFSETGVQNFKVVQPQIRGNKKTGKDRKKNEPEKSEAVAVNQNGSKVFNVVSYDAKGEIVKDLTAENYKVFVNDKERKINTFKPFKNGMNIVLMFDNSTSATVSEDDDVKKSFINFIDKIRPQDKLFLVSYDDGVKLLATPDSDRKKVKEKIEKIKPGSGTSVYDAIDAFFSKVQSINTDLPTAVILFTDGVDTTSRNNRFQQILQKAENYNAVFSVIYQDTFAEFNGLLKDDSQFGMMLSDILRKNLKMNKTDSEESKAEYALGVTFLNSLASSSGGRMISPDSKLKEYNKAFEKIYEEFQNMNSLGFESGIQNSDSVKIAVNRPNLKIATNKRLVFEDK